MSEHGVTAEQVGMHYDQMSDYYRLVWEDNVHIGYWTPDAPDVPLTVAQENLTELLIKHTPVGAGQRVLDVGCGFGRPAVRLAEKTGCDVVGITISQVQAKEAQRYAQERALAAQVAFHYMDAMTMDFAAASFDAAWAFECLFHVPQRAEVLANIARVLRPGGRLVLTDFSLTAPLLPTSLTFIRSHYSVNSYITLAECVALLEAHNFRCIEKIDMHDNIIKFYQILNLNIMQKAPALKEIFGEQFLAQWEQLRPIQDELAQKISYYFIAAEKVA